MTEAPMQSHQERSQQQIDEAQSHFDDFIGECGRLHFAFDGLGSARELYRNQFERTYDPQYRDASMANSYQTNDDPNNIQLTSLATMKRGDLLTSLQRGGDFECKANRAMLVFMFHLWNDNYRIKIARALSLRPGQVRNDLFGDMRILRNSIIHNNSYISANDIRKLKVLPTIWTIAPGEIILDNNRLNPLMAELNTNELRIEF